jgi:HK97 family phage portal protein
MGFLQNLTRGLGFQASDGGGAPAPWSNYWYEPLGMRSSSGMAVTEDSAKRVATVLACVGILGRNVGSMPCKIYTEGPDGSKKLVRQHPLYDVLYSRPNAQQTAFEWKQMMQGHLELRGNAYSEIVPGPRGAVDQLIPLHPDRVTVQQLKPSGRLLYKYNDPLTGNTRNLVQEEVFHLRNFSDDGLVGQSTVRMACDTFGIALAQQDYTARFLQNDARTPVYFTGTNFKNKEDEDRFRQGVQAGQTGANRGKAGILPAGVDIKTIGVNPSDQELLDGKKYSRLEIASIFGIPPHLIGESEKAATYASVEQFNIMYVVYCLLPRLVLWEQAIQRDLITSPKFFAKFDMAELLRGDTASRYAAYSQALSLGFMCQDEVRALEGLNPIPGGAGKKYWRPLAWTTLDAVPVAPTLPTPESAADVDDDGDPSSGDQGPNDGDNGADAAAKALEREQHAASMRDRLNLLASSAADRCVRKEVAGLRKLSERGMDTYQLAQFYEDHAEFVQTVMHLDAAALGQDYFHRASALMEEFAEHGSATGLIDKIAVSESMRLATLAVGAA